MNERSRLGDDEAAAIAAAVALWSRSRAPAPEVPVRMPAWALAARLPELEIDDLRALACAGNAAACSTRF